MRTLGRLLYIIERSCLKVTAGLISMIALMNECQNERVMVDEVWSWWGWVSNASWQKEKRKKEESERERESNRQDKKHRTPNKYEQNVCYGHSRLVTFSFHAGEEPRSMEWTFLLLWSHFFVFVYLCYIWIRCPLLMHQSQPFVFTKTRPAEHTVLLLILFSSQGSVVLNIRMPPHRLCKYRQLDSEDWPMYLWKQQDLLMETTAWANWQRMDRRHTTWCSTYSTRLYFLRRGQRTTTRQLRVFFCFSHTERNECAHHLVEDKATSKSV